MNRFGLDSRYFKEQLGLLVRDADMYAPDEMERALTRLAAVARDQAAKRFGDNTSSEPPETP